MRLALFQPDIPQNLGAAIRLTACMGVALEIIEPCAFPLSDKAIRRAAMDYGDVAQVTRHAGWEDFLAGTRKSGARIVLFTTRGAEPFHRFAYREDDVLLFGRESARLVIPIQRGMRSLNLAVSAAIGLAEGLRQTESFPV
jgi:tRNA (cytidine/uridine-2'-O-)-methyltransferase